VNIGNARLYGLEADLQMVGNQYQTAVSLLFVTYCVSDPEFLITVISTNHKEVWPFAIPAGALRLTGSY
jgi:hypothetical protein